MSELCGPATSTSAHAALRAGRATLPPSARCRRWLGGHRRGCTIVHTARAARRWSLQAIARRRLPAKGGKMDGSAVDAVLLDLPFRGRWLARNSPARRVPSHGTDAFGETYAIVVLALGPGGPFVLLAHLRRGSVRVQPGQSVRSGDQLGGCGNSGNSTQPHVHVQVTDSTRWPTAKGLPLAFRRSGEFGSDAGDRSWIPAESEIFTV